MRWRTRAWLLRQFAARPGGYRVYQFLQRHLGEFRKPEYVLAKLRSHREAAELLLRAGVRLDGARVVEVGTGWVPVEALAFWVCGASVVHTFDKNRHLHLPLTARFLRWAAGEEEQLAKLWDGVAPAGRARHCLGLMGRLADRPLDLLREANVRYLAPGDATRTGLPDASVDLHYSVTVLEHVPRPVIAGILGEARRVLTPGGACWHDIDPSDHFAHSDPGISRVNFLRFGDREWDRLAGHFLAYHNRLRQSDFAALFRAAGFEFVSYDAPVDPRSLDDIRGGLPLAPEFRGIDPEELCRTFVRVIARPAPAVTP